MTSDDTGDLKAENAAGCAALDAVFELFRDERMMLVELDGDARVVRCNAGYAAACRQDAGRLTGTFPPGAFTVSLPGNPAGHPPSPEAYLFAAREEWHAGEARCRIRWIKLWRYADDGGPRFFKLGERDGADPAYRPAYQDQMQAFLDAAPDAIITIDEAGSMVSVNPATQSLFGYRPEELIGRNVATLMPSPHRERHDRYIEHYLETGDARVIGVGRDVTAQRKDGSTFPARLSVSEFQAGGQRFFTGILHDISARIEAQEQQRALFAEHAHASRVVALGEMASSIAHEINQPLTAIVSYADAARRLMEADQHNVDQLAHALREIAGQGQRAGEIIRRLREFVKKKAPSRSSAEINEIVRTAVEFTRHDIERHGVVLNLALHPGRLDACVDRLQIEQVVLNLVRNSLDAIIDSDTPNGRITVNSRLEDGRISISVADNGPGIQPSEQDNVFESFYTTKEKGTGLGLSISHSIVEAHGGELTFRPNKPRGVTFEMTMPVDIDE